jgi:leucyl-tRNA synthetase
LEHLRFNTAIAALMELLNEIHHTIAIVRPELQRYSIERFIVLLAPLAPHFAEELWHTIGNTVSIFESPVWYSADPAALIEDTVNIAVQVNGKLRGTIAVAKGAEQSDVKETALQQESVQRHTEGKTLFKEIFVKDKILNLLVK